MFERRDYFILIAAAIAFIYSVLLWFGGLGAPNKEAGLFVAVWVPSILSLGCFAKLAFTSLWVAMFFVSYGYKMKKLYRRPAAEPPTTSPDSTPATSNR